MKFLALIAAASVAVVSAQAPECDTAVLLGAAQGPDATKCKEATGFSPIELAVPTGEKLAKVCGEASCQALLAAVSAAVPTECTFSGIPIKATLVDGFKKACASVGPAPGPAPTTVAPAPGPTTVAPTTTKPAVTTATPDATTKAPTATTMAPTDGSATTTPPATTETPSETTDAPKETAAGSADGSTNIQSPDAAGSKDATITKPTAAPVTKAPESGATAVATAAGAVVFAVAASLF